MHICLLTVVAEKTLFTILMAMFDNAFASAVRTVRAVCLLIVDVQDLNDIVDNSINIRIAKSS